MVTVDVSVMYAGVDLVGSVSAAIWYVLDNSAMVTYNGVTYSLLDWFLIGGVILDVAYDILDELMP